MMMRSLKYSLPAIACVVALACSGGGSPTDPGSVVDTPSANRSGVTIGTATQDASNTRPVLVLRTEPPLSDTAGSSGRRFVAGAATLQEGREDEGLLLPVRFKLCASKDSDEGDSLNWQYHWGDDGTDPFPPPATHPSPTFNSNFAGECRATHDYTVGTWTATLSVTDKHQDDNEVVGLKRDTIQVDIIALDVSSGNSTSRISPVVSPEASWLESLWG